MKNSLSSSRGSYLGISRSARLFFLFLAVITALSLFGGYRLSRLTYHVHDVARQRAERLLEIEENLDVASISLGRQVQEWKDMLLRADNKELYDRHRKAFTEASVDVQKALLQARTAMSEAGMNTDGIDRLSAEHKALLAKYIQAHDKLNLRRKESPHAVDQQVMGMDRDLQSRFAIARGEIELRAREMLNGDMPGQTNQYMLMGALGGAALLFMALIGFAFASRILDQGRGYRSY